MARSNIFNLDLSTGERVAAAPDLGVRATSSTLGWVGMTAELHSIQPDHFAEHTIQTHRLTIHLGAPTRYEFREGGKWQPRTLVQGALCLLSHGAVNEPRWHDTMDFLAVGFDPGFLRESFGDALSHGATDVRPVRGEVDPVVARMADVISRELANPMFEGRLFGELAALALARHLLVRYGGGVAAPRGALTGSQLARVTDYLQAHLGEDVGLKALGAQAGVSPYHFARLFRSATGLSPHQHVLRLRVARACRLIRSSACQTLAEVAAASGFSDQAHLTRTFKRIVGATPSAFAAT